MKQGELLRAKKVVHWYSGRETRGSITYGPPDTKKKYVMVFAFMGLEPLDGSDPLDVEKILRAMGWKRAASGGNPPTQEEGEGEMQIGLSPDEKMVAVAFPGADGFWFHMSPDQAYRMAQTLMNKAEEVKKKC